MTTTTTPPDNQGLGERAPRDPDGQYTERGSTRAAHEHQDEEEGEGDHEQARSASIGEWVDVRDLVPWAKNPKVITAAMVEEVRTSIRKHGWGAPILAHWPSRTIIAGHRRRLAAVAELGDDPLWTLPDGPEPGLVPVRWMKVRDANGRPRFGTWEEAEGLALSDQRTAQNSVWDETALARVIRDMRARDPKIDLSSTTAFTQDEVRRLLQKGRTLDRAQVPIPLPNRPPRSPKSRAGEVYELGLHRLLCGDATDLGAPATDAGSLPLPGAWGRVLLPGEKLDAIWTDPPYGVAYVGGNHGVMNPEARKAAGGMTIENDDGMSPDELRVFLRALLAPAAAACKPGAVWHVAAPQGPLHNVFGDVLLELDIWRRSLTWLKDAFVLGRGDRHYRTEPLFYGWKPGAGHKWNGPTNADNVLIYARPRSSKYHPTMKPPELVRECIRYATDPEELVGDPCAGSGTTLMAAAAESRIARVIELDPKYCDVIRDRWTRWAEKAGIDPGAGALKLPT